MAIAVCRAYQTRGCAMVIETVRMDRTSRQRVPRRRAVARVRAPTISNVKTIGAFPSRGRAVNNFQCIFRLLGAF